MAKNLPSEKVSKEIAELLENNKVGNEGFFSEVIRKSVKKIVQEILEQEVQDYLGRGYYERNPESRCGYRNGYEPKRMSQREIDELRGNQPESQSSGRTPGSDLGPLSP